MIKQKTCVFDSTTMRTWNVACLSCIVYKWILLLL
jgi:hypothetical protein